MTKLAKLIAHEEGFGRAGKIPTTHHNPGDLRHSLHSHHTAGPDEIGMIDTDAHGWEDLERQLMLFAQRGLTLEQAIYTFAPPNENDSARYLHDVCAGLGVSPETPVADVLSIQA